jgi:hypothetical protein
MGQPDRLRALGRALWRLRWWLAAPLVAVGVLVGILAWHVNSGGIVHFLYGAN